MCPAARRLFQRDKLTPSDILKWNFWIVIDKKNSSDYISVASAAEPNRTTFMANETHEFLKTISSCRKTAVIEYENQFSFMLQYFQAMEDRVDPGLFKIGGNIGVKRYRLEIGTVGKISGYLYGRFQRIISSGIYNIWDKWYKRKHPQFWQAEVQKLEEDGTIDLANEPKPLRMDSNLITAFHILAYGSLAALAGFAMEVVLGVFYSIIRMTLMVREMM